MNTNCTIADELIVIVILEWTHVEDVSKLCRITKFQYLQWILNWNFRKENDIMSNYDIGYIFNRAFYIFYDLGVLDNLGVDKSRQIMKKFMKTTEGNALRP